jgi:hypothetical protein
MIPLRGRKPFTIGPYPIASHHRITPSHHTIAPHHRTTPSHHTIAPHHRTTPSHHTIASHHRTTPSHHTIASHHRITPSQRIIASHHRIAMKHTLAVGFIPRTNAPRRFACHVATPQNRCGRNLWFAERLGMGHDSSVSRFIKQGKDDEIIRQQYK